MDAIDSALAQTYKNIEVIVVDDGSTDGSLNIAREYGNKITLISQVNKGLASARNSAIMAMSGDYFLPLDADDKLYPHAVQRIVDTALETGADIVAPSLQEFGLSKAVVSLMYKPTFDDFKVGNRLAYCSAIKWGALIETGGYSPRMDALGGFEDLHLWYDLMRRGKMIATIPEPLVMYRVKEESMYTKTKGREKELWAQIVKDFPETKDHAK